VVDAKKKQFLLACYNNNASMNALNYMITTISGKDLDPTYLACDLSEAIYRGAP
jgi:hypothetical protein